MSQTALTESQLHQSVEQLRQQYPNTIDLYKAVAGLLFFHYDSTPTTNRMYQLVRKGSMSAPAEALKLFWQELRERSHVRMEQADLPAGLKNTVGMLASQMWEESLQYAQLTAEKQNQQLFIQVAEAEKDKQQAVLHSQQLQSTLLNLEQLVQNKDQLIEQQRLEQQEQQLQIMASQNQIQLLNEQKLETQLQHEKNLETQKEQVLLSEQRAQDMEKYARLEIERVRQDAIKQQLAEQQRFVEQQKKQQLLQEQFQALQSEYLELQQQYRYQQNQLQQTKEQHELIEQKNQDLHALLQQLQQRLDQPSTPRSLPSRLAKQRAKKTKTSYL